MANMPGFEHGMELIKENPTLRCGVHMTLTCYKPILKDHKTIVDENGNFFRSLSEDLLKNIDLEEVYREFKAQIERVRVRVEITHLDSHHHVHGTEFLKPVIERVVPVEINTNSIKIEVDVRRAETLKFYIKEEGTDYSENGDSVDVSKEISNERKTIEYTYKNLKTLEEGKKYIIKVVAINNNGDVEYFIIC